MKSHQSHPVALVFMSHRGTVDRRTTRTSFDHEERKARVKSSAIDDLISGKEVSRTKRVTRFADVPEEASRRATNRTTMKMSKAEKRLTIENMLSNIRELTGNSKEGALESKEYASLIDNLAESGALPTAAQYICLMQCTTGPFE